LTFDLLGIKRRQKKAMQKKKLILNKIKRHKIINYKTDFCFDLLFLKKKIFETS